MICHHVKPHWGSVLECLNHWLEALFCVLEQDMICQLETSLGLSGRVFESLAGLNFTGGTVLCP